MKRYEIESLQRWLALDTENLKQSKECLINAKWYQPLYKRRIREWITTLEARIKIKLETLEHQINKHYKL